MLLLLHTRIRTGVLGSVHEAQITQPYMFRASIKFLEPLSFNSGFNIGTIYSPS